MGPQIPRAGKGAAGQAPARRPQRSTAGCSAPRIFGAVCWEELYRVSSFWSNCTLQCCVFVVSLVSRFSQLSLSLPYGSRECILVPCFEGLISTRLAVPPKVMCEFSPNHSKHVLTRTAAAALPRPIWPGSRFHLKRSAAHFRGGQRGRGLRS